MVIGGKIGYDNYFFLTIIMVQRHWRNHYFLALHGKFIKKRNISLTKKN